MYEEGPSALPSVMGLMRTTEAVQRMMTSSEDKFSNMYYNKDGSGREQYYIRFDLKNHMYKDIDLSRDIFQCFGSA